MRLPWDPCRDRDLRGQAVRSVALIDRQLLSQIRVVREQLRTMRPGGAGLVVPTELLVHVPEQQVGAREVRLAGAIRLHFDQALEVRDGLALLAEDRRPEGERHRLVEARVPVAGVDLESGVEGPVGLGREHSRHSQP